jgi:hypothetical protein
MVFSLFCQRVFRMGGNSASVAFHRAHYLYCLRSSICLIGAMRLLAGGNSVLEHFSVGLHKAQARRQYAQYGKREATLGKLTAKCSKMCV